MHVGDGAIVETPDWNDGDAKMRRQNAVSTGPLQVLIITSRSEFGVVVCVKDDV